MLDDKPPALAQGQARRGSTIELRWRRSQKLAGYYDAEQHALIYQDAHGREVDRVDLPHMRREKLTQGIE